MDLNNLILFFLIGFNLFFYKYFLITVHRHNPKFLNFGFGYLHSHYIHIDIMSNNTFRKTSLQNQTKQKGDYFFLLYILIYSSFNIISSLSR
jgi:hypothetical protein